MKLNSILERYKSLPIIDKMAQFSYEVTSFSLVTSAAHMNLIKRGDPIKVYSKENL
jgi:hypothetical protein